MIKREDAPCKKGSREGSAVKKSPVPRWYVILCVVTVILWTICVVCYGTALDLTGRTDQMVLGLSVVTTVIWWVRFAVLFIRFFRSRSA